MDRIISLLQEKNHYLEKFYSINERQIVDIVDGQYEGLEAFYKNREKILEMIQYIDGQVDKEADSLRFRKPTAAQKQHVEIELNIKNKYVEKILDQDLRLISLIETAKAAIIGELGELKKGRKAVSKYKTRTFDNALDEKL